MFHLNKARNLLLFSLLFFCFILMPVKAFEVVKPTKEFYVNDYANILSNGTEEYIIDKSVALNNVDGTQIVVVTVPNLGDASLEDYAYKLFQEFGIGDKDKDNGLLLLLALEERKFRVEVGNGLEGILPDGKTGRFQDKYIIPYLKDDKWDEGIKNGYDAFYTEIVKLNELDLSYQKPKDMEHAANWDILFMFFSLIVGYIVGRIFRVLPKCRKVGTIIYIVVASIIYFFITKYMLFNLVAFLAGRFLLGMGYSSGGFSGGGGFSSGGGYSGGGGSSSGGGSSRDF